MALSLSTSVAKTYLWQAQGQELNLVTCYYWKELNTIVTIDNGVVIHLTRIEPHVPIEKLVGRLDYIVSSTFSRMVERMKERNNQENDDEKKIVFNNKLIVPAMEEKSWISEYGDDNGGAFIRVRNHVAHEIIFKYLLPSKSNAGKKRINIDNTAVHIEVANNAALCHDDIGALWNDGSRNLNSFVPTAEGNFVNYVSGTLLDSNKNLISPGTLLDSNEDLISLSNVRHYAFPTDGNWIATLVKFDRLPPVKREREKKKATKLEKAKKRPKNQMALNFSFVDKPKH